MEPIEFADGERRLTSVTYKGRPCWLATEVSEFLGYKGHDVGYFITRRWGKEFIEGWDFDKLAGQELREFKGLLEVTDKLSVTYAQHLILLYEPGLHIVCLKTKFEAGKRLRRMLADRVLPQLARTGEYRPELDAGASPKPLPETRLDDAARRAELLVQMAKVVRDSNRPDLLEKIVNKTLTVVDPPKPRAPWMPPAGEVKVLPLPKTSWKTPSAIAKELVGVTPNRVGRAITRLNLRGREGLCVTFFGEVPNGTVRAQHAYSEKAVEMIKNELNKNGFTNRGARPSSGRYNQGNLPGI